MMQRLVYLSIAVALLAYLGLCLAMFVFQRSLLYYPQPAGAATADSTLRLDVPGAQLAVSVRPAPGNKALLYFGGNGEDVSQSLASFAQAFPDRALYLLHYRGYGGSTGKPTEQANVADARALFDEVSAQHGDIAVIGRSLGSGIAIQLASERPVRQLVLVTPHASIVEIAAARYPYVPVRWLLLDRYESWRYAPAIRAPTLLVAAEHDATIPRASTVKLQGCFAPGVATLTTIAGVGHNDIGHSDDYLKILRAALP